MGVANARTPLTWKECCDLRCWKGFDKKCLLTDAMLAHDEELSDQLEAILSQNSNLSICVLFFHEKQNFWLCELLLDYHILME